MSPLPIILCCCNVIHVSGCTAWNCQNSGIITMRTESKRCPHILITPLRYSSACQRETFLHPRVSRWTESLSADLADVISAALSLPQSLWLTCSLIYSQRGADDGPGCVRGGGRAPTDVIRTTKSIAGKQAAGWLWRHTACSWAASPLDILGPDYKLAADLR